LTHTVYVTIFRALLTADGFIEVDVCNCTICQRYHVILLTQTSSSATTRTTNTALCQQHRRQDGGQQQKLQNWQLKSNKKEMSTSG